MSPQSPQFNRGIWKKLESHVRDLASLNDSVIVVTGGDLNDSLEVIGDNRVGVPNFYFKVIYVFKGINSDTIGYYLPNQKIEYNLENYILDVDTIGKRTGIKFN
jgi:endonuclease G